MTTVPDGYKEIPRQMHPLKKYWEGIANLLDTEMAYITNIIEHRGEKGRAREILLSNLLSRFLSNRFEVTSGFIIDSRGNISKQCDIIIREKGKIPVVLWPSSVTFFAIEEVGATIEIKSNLSIEELSGACKNSKSIKSLKYIKSQTPFLNIYEDDKISPEIVETKSLLCTAFFYQSNDYRSPRSAAKTIINYIFNNKMDSYLDLIYIFDCSLVIIPSGIKINNDGNTHCYAFSFTQNDSNTNFKHCKGLLGFLVILHELLEKQDSVKTEHILAYLPKHYRNPIPLMDINPPNITKG